MATSTTNLGLIKPSGSDKIRIAQINQNMDLVDAAVGPVGSASLQAQAAALKNGLAIVSNNNTHAAITSGQYVYVYGHGTLAEGLYVATANIGANGTLSGSNLTAVSGGGLNALNAKINTVDGEMGYEASDYVSNQDIVNVIKGFINNGSNGGTFMAISCTNTPDSTKNYKIRYTRNNGTQWVLLEAHDATNVGNCYVNDMNPSTSAIGTWNQLAIAEVSSWTPSIERATITVTSGTAKCIRSGNFVMLSATITVTASETNAAYITNASIPSFGKNKTYVNGTYYIVDSTTYGAVTGSGNGNTWFRNTTGNTTSLSPYVNNSMVLNLWYSLY